MDIVKGNRTNIGFLQSRGDFDTSNILYSSSSAAGKINYDSLYFEHSRLNEAFSDVSNLTDGGSFSDYLKNQVEAIEDLESFFTAESLSLLLSKDSSNLVEQIEFLIANSPRSTEY